MCYLFQNKPNGQFHLPFDRDVIMEFMRELPIRKVPGIGRVGERVLQALGINVRSIQHCMRYLSQRTDFRLLETFTKSEPSST